MIKKKFMFLLMLIPLVSNAQNKLEEPLRLTLVDCIEQAQENNYSRQSVILNESSTQESYNQSKMERLPNLSASIGETYTHSNNGGSDWSGNYSLNTSVTVYQGGYINSTIEKSRLSAEQSVYYTAQYDNDLTIQVLQAFFTVLGNEELLKYQNAILEASEEQLRQGKERFGAGEILKSDLLLLEAQYIDDSNNILETTIGRNNSLNVLKNLMSMEISQAIELVYPDDEYLEYMKYMPSEEEVVMRSLETLPDLRISDYNIEIAETGVRISRSAYAPTLSLNAGVGSGHINNFSNYGTQLSNGLSEQVGFSLSIPIFNHNRTKSNVVQSRIALQQAELDRKQTELDIRQTITQEYRDVVLAEGKYRSAEIRRDAYGASFDTYRLMFEQGTITTVDLLQQQNNYIGAMNDYIQSKYGFMLKRKILDVYMGEPITM